MAEPPPPSPFQVERIEPGKTALFVFHYSSRELHALYVPTCPGGLNIDKEAYVEIAKKLNHKHQGGTLPYPEGGSPFPAQVRYKTMFQFTPLQEWQWQHVVEYQKFTHHFKFWLEKHQVEQLLQLFKANHGKPQAPRPIRRDVREEDRRPDARAGADKRPPAADGAVSRPRGTAAAAPNARPPAPQQQQAAVTAN